MNIGETVTIKPSECGNDGDEGPAEVTDIDTDDLCVWINGREVWFTRQRIVEAWS